MDRQIDLGKELKKIGLGLLYIIALLTVINLIKPNKWLLILLLFISSLIFNIWGFFKYKTPINPKALAFTLIYIVLFINLMYWLDKYSVWGYIAGVLIISASILIRKRKQYIEIKHHIETMLWGKPLYKYRIQKKKPPKLW